MKRVDQHVRQVQLKSRVGTNVSSTLDALPELLPKKRGSVSEHFWGQFLKNKERLNFAAEAQKGLKELAFTKPGDSEGRRDRETERQRYKETERRKDGETERHRERDREREVLSKGGAPPFQFQMHR
jgi:hypothetical protein